MTTLLEAQAQTPDSGAVVPCAGGAGNTLLLDLEEEYCPLSHVGLPARTLAEKPNRPESGR